MLYSKPIVNMQGNYSHITKVTPTRFIPTTFIMTKCHVDVDVWLTTKISSHIIVIITLIPPNLGRNLFKPSRGVKLMSVQPVIPYSRQYKRPLNYFEYKTKIDLNFMYEYLKSPLKQMVNW